MIVHLKFSPVVILGLLILGVRFAHALDRNGDGMSDVWQRVYNIANGDASSDPDGDGQNNGKEAEAGTDPHDSNDYFRTFDFSVSPAFASVTLSWRSVEQRFYEIEESSDLITWVVAGDTTGLGGLFTTATFSIGTPINDLFVNRWPASTSTTQITVSNTGATAETGEPINPSVAGGTTVWWSWSSITSGLVTITTAGSDFDTTLAIYSGSGFSNLVLLGANDDSGGLQSAVTFTAQAGVHYSIQVNGYSGATGSIVLNHPISSGLLPPPNITPNGPSKMFFRVRGYPDNDTDNDGDSLFTWEERLLGTDPADYDGDNDGMADGFEFIYQFDPLSAADAQLDADGDLLKNAFEARIGSNPRLVDSDSDGDGLIDPVEIYLGTNPNVQDSDGNGTSDANEDKDLDGLTNIQEILTHGTDPAQPDTDLDGLTDGWEITYGFSALINNDTDINPNNDSSADPDGDGLDNGAEDQIGTNPNNSDTDGDGFSDFAEDQAGSNANGGGSTPGNPGGTPGGPASPPPPIISVQVNFGDHSGSHSEKYKVILEPQSGDANTQKRYRTNRTYGQTQTETFNLPAGAKYKITFVHVGTDPQYTGTPKPDYDYTLEFTSGSTDATIASIPEDPAGMLGVHDESEAFFASGKNASLYIAWLNSNTVAAIPADRKRTKLGVGEEVDLNVTPSINGITWTASVGKLDQTSGPNSKLSLADTTGAASVTVNYLGKTLTKNFTVFAPTGVVSSSVASTESYPVGTQGAGMHLYPVVVGPTDVSFYNVQMLEVGRAASSITGYFLNNTPISHIGHGADEWFPLDYANQWPSSWDYANLYGYPAPWTPGGSFTWIIPAKWKVGNTGTEHTIIGWDQVFEIQSNGTTTIRKFGHSVTRTINDISTSN